VPVIKLHHAEQRVTVGSPSKPESTAGSRLKFGEVLLRLTGAALRVVIMFAASHSGWAAGPPPPAQQGAEAASPLGWHKYVTDEGAIIGMNTYGESGAIADLMKHFGFTADNVVTKAKELLS